MTATAEIMFLQWGQWQKGGSGLSGVNIIYRCMQFGPGAGKPITGEPHMSATVELVERFCLTLKPPFRYAINHRYIYNSPDNYAAKRLHCSPDIYRTRLDTAANMLENYLVAN